MKDAYTIVRGLSDGPHWDVGVTFETKGQAERYCVQHPRAEYLHVVSWVDDFTEVDRGVLLFRSDGIHEVSWVVAEEPTETVEYAQEGCVGTTLVADGEPI